tara:strand:+ start:163 stop:417 length:255 start_codon:yes stop_codon:yes gene_type:complete
MKAAAQIYSIIKIEDLDLIDFNEVFETSQETIRKSLNAEEFVIKYNTVPSFIVSGAVVPLQILTHSQCLILMHTPAWSEPIPAE